MKLFDVYPLFDINIVKGSGCRTYDDKGVEYLDLYGGHAVISIGHSHPHYVEKLTSQARELVFYSNSVVNKLQLTLAESLGKISGYEDYSLFLINSGAEANENALKLASFATGKAKILAFGKSFHGRTSGAVSATDNPKIRAPFNATDKVTFVQLGDIAAVEQALATGQYAAVVLEGIQGVAGIYEAPSTFWQQLRSLCDCHGVMLIADEIQSGYGRTGKFFAHQHYGIKADIITTAKGMGNGFPIGGVIISPSIRPSYGMLGTTFGGNHLACAAATAVLDIIEDENLVENAARIGEYFRQELSDDKAVKEYRGKGLMIGLELKEEYIGLRDKLLFEKHFFTGAAGAGVIRLLPSLTVSRETAESFVKAWKELTR